MGVLEQEEPAVFRQDLFTTMKHYLEDLHIDSGIKQFVQVLFAGGVPYQHLNVPDHKRTNDLVQDQEQEIPATVGMSSNPRRSVPAFSARRAVLQTVMTEVIKKEKYKPF
jgi:hypothetical protein